MAGNSYALTQIMNNAREKRKSNDWKVKKLKQDAPQVMQTVKSNLSKQGSSGQVSGSRQRNNITISDNHYDERRRAMEADRANIENQKRKAQSGARRRGG